MGVGAESPPPAARRRALFASIFSIARSGDIGPAPFVLSIDDERPRIIERGGERAPSAGVEFELDEWHDSADSAGAPT